MFRSFFLALFAAACVPAVAAAAIQMPNNDPLPKEAIKDPNAFQKQGWMHWIAFDGFEPRESWDYAAAATNAVAPLQFMTPCFVFTSYQAAGQETNNWLLVGTIKPEGDKLNADVIWGWVPEAAVINNRSALKNKKSGIEYKVIMVIDPKHMKDSDGKPLDAGWLFASPRPGAMKSRQMRLYDPLYVYKFLPPNDPKPQFALVGISSSFGTASDGEKRVIGWVDFGRSPVTRWDTKQGIEWTATDTWPDVPSDRRRTVPAEVVESIDGAYAAFYPSYLKGRVTEPSRLLFPEKFAKVKEIDAERIPPPLRERWNAIRKDPRYQDFLVSRGFKPRHMRPPLLDTTATVSTVSTAASDRKVALPRIAEDEGNELLYVGGIGGRDTLTNEDLDEIRFVADRMAGNVQEIEIVFVVDRTGSMAKYFDDVADMIEQITNDAAGRPGKVSVGVAFYDDDEAPPVDRAPGAPPVEIVSRLVPLNAAGGAAAGKLIAANVRAHTAVGGGRPGESMLFAFEHSISQMGFADWSQKLVVMLTDEGDRVFRDGLAKEVTALNRLESVLLPSDVAPIELAVMQVSTAELASGDLTRQMSHLLKEEPNWRKKTARGRPLVSHLEAKKPADVSGFMKERYESVKADADRAAIDMARIQSLDSPADVGPEARRLFESASGLSLEKYLDSAAQPQLFSPGYIWRQPHGMENRDPPIPQVRVSILLSRNELEKVIFFMDDFIDDAEKSPLDAIRTLVQAATGPGEVAKTGSDVAKKKFGIDFTTPLFRLDPEAQDRGLSRADLEEVKYRRTILKGIYNREAYTFKTVPKTVAGETLQIKEVDRMFSYDRFFRRFKDSDDWVWIREDELP